MNLKEIKEMINLMNENNLNELEVERDGLRVRLKKGPAGVEHTIMPAAPAPEKTAPSGMIEIKSPMVGTFYRAPAPEADPYVRQGEDIEAGQVVCIIEAMKLMNEIKSEVKGRVVSILVENAEPVEFGQVLFLVEPR